MRKGSVIKIKKKLVERHLGKGMENKLSPISKRGTRWKVTSGGGSTKREERTDIQFFGRMIPGGRKRTQKGRGSKKTGKGKAGKIHPDVQNKKKEKRKGSAVVIFSPRWTTDRAH